MVFVLLHGAGMIPTMIVPKNIRLGDTLGIIAPSSPPKDKGVVKQALKDLKNLGFKVQVGASVHSRKGYLAGTDAVRLKDLHSFFADPKIKGILCLRGGYGSARLLPNIDFNLIKKNPKFFCGYSDITALHLAMYHKAGLATFHGPTLLTLFPKGKTSAFTTSSFLRVAHGRQLGDISRGLEKKIKTTTIVKGKTSGILLGGNLSILASLVGTPWIPSFKNSILFLEDVNEAPYRIDRMLTQLIQSGTLKGVKGIALGTWRKCEAEHKKTQSSLEVFKDKLTPLKIPVCMGFPFGHIEDTATIPYGRVGELDASKGLLVIR